MLFGISVSNNTEVSYVQHRDTLRILYPPPPMDEGRDGDCDGDGDGDGYSYPTQVLVIQSS